MDRKEKELLQLVAHTIRVISAEMVENAKSGHPGAPMGLAEIAAVLWGKILKVNPDDPTWKNRDRFILSAGHASAMLYTVLHLMGFDIKIEDLKNFRKWGSITPGHPEFSPEAWNRSYHGTFGTGFCDGSRNGNSTKKTYGYLQ